MGDDWKKTFPSAGVAQLVVQRLKSISVRIENGDVTNAERSLRLWEQNLDFSIARPSYTYRPAPPCAPSGQQALPHGCIPFETHSATGSGSPTSYTERGGLPNPLSEDSLERPPAHRMRSALRGNQPQFLSQSEWYGTILQPAHSSACGAHRRLA